MSSLTHGLCKDNRQSDIWNNIDCNDDCGIATLWEKVDIFSFEILLYIVTKIQLNLSIFVFVVIDVCGMHESWDWHRGDRKGKIASLYEFLLDEAIKKGFIHI